jgi:hypothetical protein
MVRQHRDKDQGGVKKICEYGRQPKVRLGESNAKQYCNGRRNVFLP